MKRTKVAIELVDASDEQLSDIVQMITKLGSVIVSFNVETRDASVPSWMPRSEAKNGQYLFASDANVDAQNMDPANNKSRNVNKLSIKPNVDDLGNVDSKDNEDDRSVKQSDLKNYL